MTHDDDNSNSYKCRLTLQISASHAHFCVQSLCCLICSQEKAVKWYSDDNVDGLTTNGVFIMQPQGGFTPAGKPGPWREVSVGGGLFSLRDSRPSPLKSHQVGE